MIYLDLEPALLLLSEISILLPRGHLRCPGKDLSRRPRPEQISPVGARSTQSSGDNMERLFAGIVLFGDGILHVPTNKVNHPHKYLNMKMILCSGGNCAGHAEYQITVCVLKCLITYFSDLVNDNVRSPVL